MCWCCGSRCTGPHGRATTSGGTRLCEIANLNTTLREAVGLDSRSDPFRAAARCNTPIGSSDPQALKRHCASGAKPLLREAGPLVGHSVRSSVLCGPVSCHEVDHVATT